MKKFCKSRINQKIFKSIKKMGVVLTVLFCTISIGRIGGTNAFFQDSVTVSGNSFSAGYWTPPTVSISSPSAGNKWQVGSSHDINWSAASADPAATVGMDIDYACDSDAWTNIATGTANDGTFSWTVPEDISNSCKIKITATDSHTLTNSVESDNFEISYMVVLNEFLPNPPGDSSVERGPKPNCEWVELYNYGNTAVDVSGWYLYDADNSHALPITSTNSDNDNNPGDSGETIVPTHGWLVVYQNGDADFSLNNGNNGSGDTVRLFDGAIGSGANLLDSHAYLTINVNDTDPNNTKGSDNTLGGNLPENGEGKTFARYPDGTGSWYDPVPTPGGKNTKSNDLEDFQKYYKERCVKDDKAVSIKKDPSCDMEFLTGLGVLDAKKNVIPEIKTPAADVGAAIPADTVTDSNQDQTANPDTPAPPADGTITPADSTAGDAAVSNDDKNTNDTSSPPAVEEKPKADVAPEVKEPETPKEDAVKPEEPKKENAKQDEPKEEEPKPDDTAEQI